MTSVQVLTGTVLDGNHALDKGQVELGYSLEGTAQHCTGFALLGHLLEGQLNQEILLKSTGSEVSCAKLMVNVAQLGGLIVRNTYLREEKVRDMEAALDKRSVNTMRN